MFANGLEQEGCPCVTLPLALPKAQSLLVMSMLFWQALLALGIFASAQISGRVVTFSDAPAPFAKVMLIAEHPFGLKPPLVRKTTADEQGRFQFTPLHPTDRAALVIALTPNRALVGPSFLYCFWRKHH